MIGYYDVVLGLVPAALLGITGALYGAGIDLVIAVPVAAAAAAGVIGHGLFVNAPVDGSRATDEPTVSAPAPSAPGVTAD